MSGLQLVVLGWLAAIFFVWALVHGSKVNSGGHKARREAEQRDAWLDRMDAKYPQ